MTAAADPPPGRNGAPRDAEGRILAGRVSGLLCVIAAVTIVPAAIVVRAPGTDVLLIAVGAVVTAAWGLVSALVIDWERTPGRVMRVAGLVALALIAAAVAASGGARSPAWLYLFFVVVTACYFQGPKIAAVYVVLALGVACLPLAYDGTARNHMLVARLVVELSVLAALAGAVIAGKGLLSRQRARAERAAFEQAALRRVAVAVAAGEPADAVYALAAEQIGRVVNASGSGILRLDAAAGDLELMGAWASHGRPGYEPGTRMPLDLTTDAAKAIDHGRSYRTDPQPPGSRAHELGYLSTILAPVYVGGAVWGSIAVACERSGGFEPDAEERLNAFGTLLSTAISSTEDRARLSRLAATDPLTGLANHRALHEQLAVEVARARRHGRPLAAAIIDVDRFKQVNDSVGHAAGDRLLVRVADVLRALSRREDVLGRIGGDEFAWIFPESRATEALAALERARLELARGADGLPPLTISAGISDIECDHDPARLMAFADGALYWSKAHGRNACTIYDPDLIGELSPGERERRLERASALLGLRALARAIDAKDPLTRRHSERVSELVGRLARASGWADERASLLEEAALVHDVGKIGVPDAVLLKSGPLDAAERMLVVAHAELSARIVGDVLGPEQVAWIRAQHERPDGGGYPFGVTAEAIPEGAALLAIADAWDVMTFGRPYSHPKAAAAAIAECRGLVERQFTAVAVEALERLWANGELDAEAPSWPGRAAVGARVS